MKPGSGVSKGIPTQRPSLRQENYRPRGPAPVVYGAPPRSHAARFPQKKPADPIDFMKEFWAARVSGDPDRVMSFIADDCVWLSTTGSPIEGRAGVRAFFVKAGPAQFPEEKDYITPWTILPDADLPAGNVIVYREFMVKVAFVTFQIHQEFTIRDARGQIPKIIRCTGRNEGEVKKPAD